MVAAIHLTGGVVSICGQPATGMTGHISGVGASETEQWQTSSYIATCGGVISANSWRTFTTGVSDCSG